MKLFGFEIKKKPQKEKQTIQSNVLSNQLRVRLRSYDAAAITRHTEQHFLLADGRDADSLIRADLATLRNRARYEIRNNSYAKGITETKANDLVGTGPRLQVITDNKDFNRVVEDLFADWCLRCDAENRMTFNEILRLIGSLQQDDSGEAFVVLENAKQQMHWSQIRPDVNLRLRVIEPDRVASPGLFNVTDKVRDGIEYDESGKPIKYYILKYHPGSNSAYLSRLFDYDVVDAGHVIHLYRQERPGQSRGVPWMTPAIPLFAQLRRYTLATVSGAETAANISATLETEAPGTEFTDAIEPMDEVEIARNAMLTLPAGSKMNQFKPEQPTSTYKDFKRELINEIARCLNMPFNVAAANSSEYNYASGRLDWQVYFRFIHTVRNWLEGHFCNRVFLMWLKEAMLIPALRLPAMKLSQVQVQWFWPAAEHVDPLKEAKAQETRLKSLTSNLAIEFALQGRDWERELKQRAKEIELMEELGIYDKLQAQQAKQELARAISRTILREKEYALS